MKKGNVDYAQLISKAGTAYLEKKFEETKDLYAKCLDSPSRMDAVLGYGFSCIHLQHYEEAIAVLAGARNEGRFQFRKYVLLLLGYCYNVLQQKEEAGECYAVYCSYLVNEADENGTTLDEDPDFSFDDLEDFDPMEEDIDDFYDDDDDDDDGDDEDEDDEDNEDNEELKYKTYMRCHEVCLTEMPSVLESWADYLDGNAVWMSDDQPYKWRIGNKLDDFGGELVKTQYKEKISKEDLEESIRVAWKMYDLAAVYRPAFKANVLHKKAFHHLDKDRPAGLNMMRDLLLEFPEHTTTLHFLSKVARHEKDYDTAVDLMEKCIAVHEKRKEIKGPSLESDEMDVYFSAAFHYAETGSYDKSRTLFLKYLAAKQPHVFQYVTRPGHLPEDLWIALLDGYIQKVFPFQEPDEVVRRAILFGEIAITLHNSVKGYSGKAMLLNNAGRYEEALACCKLGFVSDAEYGHLHYTHACVLSLMGAPADEALDAIRKALRFDPALEKLLRNEADFNRIREEPGFKQLFN